MPGFIINIIHTINYISIIFNARVYASSSMLNLYSPIQNYKRNKTASEICSDVRNRFLLQKIATYKFAFIYLSYKED